ncbi:hypothetical protein N9M91_03120, partial [Porticoccaceae bacterium]|nr:hypothetical protein [Porticoccaceae bacterium]
VPVNGIDIAYRDIGRQEDPVVLMIMGLGASHRVHGDKMVKGIETAGYRVIMWETRLDLMIGVNPRCGGSF